MGWVLWVTQLDLLRGCKQVSHVGSQPFLHDEVVAMTLDTKAQVSFLIGDTPLMSHFNNSKVTALTAQGEGDGKLCVWCSSWTVLYATLSSLG